MDRVFICYVGKKHWDKMPIMSNGVFITKNKLDDIREIRDMEEFIRSMNNLEEVTIMSWRVLGREC